MEEIKVENQVDEMLEEPSGEDMLLAQIDAFRDKAKQLQTLISAKERKVKELEAMVRAQGRTQQPVCRKNLPRSRQRLTGLPQMSRHRWIA